MAEAMGCVDRNAPLPATVQGCWIGVEDLFQPANITGPVITPDGELYVHNVDFGNEFVRAE